MFHSEFKDMPRTVFTPKEPISEQFQGCGTALPLPESAPNAAAFIPVSHLCAWDKDMHPNIIIPKDHISVIICTSENRL